LIFRSSWFSASPLLILKKFRASSFDFRRYTSGVIDQSHGISLFTFC
jgi:hypothetical protein